MNIFNTAIVAIGSNQYTKHQNGAEDNISLSIQLILKNGLPVQAISPFYVSEAFPAGSGPDFVNAVISLSYSKGPESLLEMLHEIEAEMGRVREKRWGPRVIDLDLIDYSGRVFPSSESFYYWRNLSLQEQLKYSPDSLILPHPRIEDRNFVLRPLFDIYPDWVHPVTGQGIKPLLETAEKKDGSQLLRLRSQTKAL